MSIENVKELLKGYNRTYRMSKCLTSGTFAASGQIQTAVERKDGTTEIVRHPISAGTQEALASLGLYSLIENDSTPEAIKSRLAQIASGRFAQRRADDSADSIEVSIAESINDLDLSEVVEATGKAKESIIKVDMTLESLINSGMAGKLPKSDIEKLDAVIALRKADAARVKALAELFGISNAKTIEENDKTLVFSCVVSPTKWPSVMAKVLSDAKLGYTIEQTSVTLDESMTNIKFNLVKDKSVVEGNGDAA